MSKKYDHIVYIGRFQPVHAAHETILKMAAAQAHNVIVIVGSARQPRTFKNPFTSAEREHMLSEVLNNIDEDFTYQIEHNIDTIYNDVAWAVRIQDLVAKHLSPNDNVALIGHYKDGSSFYLDMFPQWARINVPKLEPLNATSVRDLYFRRDCNMRFIQGVVPDVVLNLLSIWKDSPPMNQIIAEREFTERYKQQYAGLLHEPIFVTVDAVVIQSGHVLMIRRKSEPGRGLWALPGGFVNAKTDKSLQDAMIRELKEETGIKVPVPVLEGSIKDRYVFDAVERSARGRTITHAFKIVLADGHDLPKVKGADDADKAQWIPIANVDPEECFEDHWEIIQHFVGS